MNTNNALVVDLNNIWNKYLFARKGDFSSTMSSILHLFRSIYRSKQFAKVYIVIDGKPSEKYNEYKEYKSNRKHNPDKYIPMKVLSSVLSQYFTVVGGKHVEGDEVVAYVATRLAKKYDTYIFSNDKDFIQLMQYGIHIITQFRLGCIEHVLNENEALQKFKNNKGEPLKGIHNVLPYRVFKGDSSDNIPSACKGMYDSDIRKVIYKSWVHDRPLDEDVLMMIIGKVDEPIKHTLVMHKNDILRNYKLMDLCHIPNEFKKNIQKIYYKLDVQGIQEYVIGRDLYQW